jgi:mannosyl-3-phosphoglycerate phosphatase
MRPRSLRAASLPRVVVFSDVDGTLLDASDRLALTPDDVAKIAPHVELVLASSRTLAELAILQRRLGLSASLVAENGAVVSLPARWRGSTSPRRGVIALGDRTATLVPVIHRCAAAVGVRVINQKALLPDRGRSLRRGYSVCLQNWFGETADRFLELLHESGLDATRSGTWITITRGANKGTAVRAVLDRARQLGSPFRKTVAIGNAANDVPLLMAARLRLSVKNRNGHHPELRQLPGVHLLSSSGARAWREALDLILPTGTP